MLASENVFQLKDPIPKWSWDFGLVDAPRTNISALKIEKGRMYVSSFVLEGEPVVPFSTKSKQPIVKLVIYDTKPQVLNAYEFRLTKLLDAHHDLSYVSDGLPMIVTHVYEYEFVEAR